MKRKQTNKPHWKHEFNGVVSRFLMYTNPLVVPMFAGALVGAGIKIFINTVKVFDEELGKEVRK